MTLGGKLCNFISLNRSPNQLHDLFEKCADNPHLKVILGDFNATPSSWFKHDMTTYEGSKTDTITSQCG